jgi:hypothetical protein
MEMSMQRKVGVIGVGFGAQVYIPAFRSEGWTSPQFAAATARRSNKSPPPRTSPVSMRIRSN